MPEQPPPKLVVHPALSNPRVHPASAADDGVASMRHRPPCVPRRRIAAIETTSCHSFLRGASQPEELVAHAARLGLDGMGLCDHATVGGAVRGHVAARDSGLPLAQGARVFLDLPEHAPLEMLLYASDRASWGALCAMLTKGKRAARKTHCALTVHDLVEVLRARQHGGGAAGEGLLAVLIPPRVPAQPFLEAAEGLAALMHERLAVAVRRVDDPDGVVDAERALVLARYLGVPPVAACDARMHDASRRPLLDVLACIRQQTDMARAPHLVSRNGERRLHAPDELKRRYADLPEALEWSWRLVERASAFSLDMLRYEYPAELVPEGVTAMDHLRGLVRHGAAERYPYGVPPKVLRQFEHEFAIIEDLGYAHYFLTVHEIVAFARSRGILCQGRGAAANSAVCFALGVTAVDPDRVDVLFERFISRERNEPPDIDIDFEHERREEVMQHIYAKYGRNRAALVAEIISYRGRSAVRDVGKALGFSPDAMARLANEVDRWTGGGLGSRDDAGEAFFGDDGDPASPPELAPQAAERVRAAGLDPASPGVRHLARLVGQILGFPRHRSQHVGGFVISNGPLCESVPIENAAMPGRTVIEWDKDDIEALGMLKIDILSLGMLTAIRKTIDLVNGDRMALAAGASPCRAADAPDPRPDFACTGPSSRLPLDPRPNASAAVSPTSAPASTPPDDASSAAVGVFAEPAVEPLRFHAIPPEDGQTYDMVCKADTVGVFQIESRAQMSMLPRLRPRCFYDLVIEVAIVRPGPIQGDMVHPYLRRRNGEEATVYPDDAVRKVLGKTLGVPLFQEQAMSLAVVAAGFTPGQADELRRAIAAWKRQGNRIAQFGALLEEGMVSRGYTREFARQVFEQVKGFSGYGFPESHAASFAHLVYASAWLKRHHPAAFAAALLNSQPMGFYAPAQLVRDAREHGVAVRAVDIHCSRWDCTLERGPDLAAELATRQGAAVADGLFGSAEPVGHAPPRASAAAWGGPEIYRYRGSHQASRNPAVCHLASRNLGTVRIDADPAGMARPHVEDWKGDATPARGWTRTFAASRRSVPDAVLSEANLLHAEGSMPVSPRFVHARGKSVLWMSDDETGAAMDDARDGTRAGYATAAYRAEPLCAPSAGLVADHAPDPKRFAVPTQPCIRLGLRMVRGLAVEDALRLVDAVVRYGSFGSMAELSERTGLSAAPLRRLAAADAFRSMGLDRQQATWQILALRDRGRVLWSFASEARDAANGTQATPHGAACAEAACPPSTSAAQHADDRVDDRIDDRIDDYEPALPRIHELDAIARDLESTGVALSGHPIACIRAKLDRMAVTRCGELRDEDRVPTSTRVSVAGIVLVRQRPSTAKGIVFMTIEDESGIANLIYRPKVYERVRAAVRHSVAVRVEGQVERRHGVVHVLVRSARSLDKLLGQEGGAMTSQSRDFH